MCTEEVLNKMVFDGVLPDRTTAEWHPTAGERFPKPHLDELVVFEDFFRQGFGLPMQSS